MRELSEFNLEFSLELTGFDMAEIDLLIEGACGVPEEDADDLHPPVGSGPAIARPGDLWLLGRHRVHQFNAAVAHAMDLPDTDLSWAAGFPASPCRPLAALT